MKKKPNWLAILGLPSIYRYVLENSSLSIGESAPDFELTSLTGETIRLSQF